MHDLVFGIKNIKSFFKDLNLIKSRAIFLIMVMGQTMKQSNFIEFSIYFNDISKFNREHISIYIYFNHYCDLCQYLLWITYTCVNLLKTAENSGNELYWETHVHGNMFSS